MPVELRHVTIKTPDLLFLRRKHGSELLRKPVDIRKEANPLTFVVDHVQQLVLKHVDWLFEAIEHEAVRVEAAFTEAIEHRGTLIKCGLFAPEDAAGASWLVAFFNDGDMEPFFGEQARRC